MGGTQGKLTAALKDSDDRAKVKASFDSYDVDKNGVLDRKELLQFGKDAFAFLKHDLAKENFFVRTMVSGVMKILTEEEFVAHCINIVDVDGDGEVSWNEFETFCVNHDGWEDFNIQNGSFLKDTNAMLDADGGVDVDRLLNRSNNNNNSNSPLLANHEVCYFDEVNIETSRSFATDVGMKNSDVGIKVGEKEVKSRTDILPALIELRGGWEKGDQSKGTAERVALAFVKRFLFSDKWNKVCVTQWEQTDKAGYHPPKSEMSDGKVVVSFWTVEHTGKGPWSGPPFVTEGRHHVYQFDSVTGESIALTNEQWEEMDSKTWDVPDN